VLKDTRGQEKVYKEILKSQEKTAAQIRAELFSLRGTAAIPFGQALDFANAASAKTGVRPAFILGILAEESNLGENIGSGSWKVDMHPTRDVPIFLLLPKNLVLIPIKCRFLKKHGMAGEVPWVLRSLFRAHGHVMEDLLIPPQVNAEKILMAVGRDRGSIKKKTIEFVR
jgi:hypothetical protein